MSSREPQNSQDWTGIRRTLEQRLLRLRDNLHRKLENLEPPRCIVDSAEQSVAIRDSDLNLAEIKRDSRETMLVEEALSRLDSGTYGRCVACDESINPVRLRKLPTASRCVECQQHLEYR